VGGMVNFFGRGQGRRLILFLAHFSFRFHKDGIIFCPLIYIFIMIYAI
jgi:hypothetical protein